MNNGAGNAALLEVTLLDGSMKRILLDSGWNVPYMTKRFEQTGVADLLKQRQIDYLVISHEHYDHFWGIEAALRLDPRVTMVLPATIRAEAADFRQAKAVSGSAASKSVAHTGEVILTQAGLHPLFPGAGLTVFDMSFNWKIRGEQSLVFNIKDKGMVLVSGCCHQGIEKFADFVLAEVKGGDNLYGFYGGLCTAPLGVLDDKQAWVIRNMGKYGFKTIAANHCTGIPGVQKMKDLGYPVVGGRGLDGSVSNLYPGNGDSVLFA
jgi:7,8-dihydropterin-6-yl-methyl-4-(beta-D-ribofuranosyl)aminobenzene 5'-phosphate synthase